MHESIMYFDLRFIGIWVQGTVAVIVGFNRSVRESERDA